MELERHAGAEHLRVSDREREQVIELLGRAAAEGRLTLDEYADRAGAAYGAKTHGELAQLTTDLPATDAQSPAAPPAVGPAPEHVVAIFGSESRTGNWPVPRRLKTWAVFGDCQVELQDAALQQAVTTIEATALFGSVTVFVPDGVDVRLSGTAVFGEKESKLPGPARPGAPVLEVRSRVLFGSVTVRRPRGR